MMMMKMKKILVTAKHCWRNLKLRSIMMKAPLMNLSFLNQFSLVRTSTLVHFYNCEMMFTNKLVYAFVLLMFFICGSKN